jgi:signal peptidase I
MGRPRTAALSKKAAAQTKKTDARKPGEGSSKAARETVESIAVAVILAFLFRAFVAEAFVIPTGSMAPTLQGRHMDVECEKCGCPYRGGASQENDGSAQVVATTCPICRYAMDLDKVNDPNQRSFNGDRILVSKFAYEVGSPKRWDVIVFKYPGNAKQNYIKRLIGLPNETIRVFHGDIYYRPNGSEVADGDAQFRIARKEPYKLRAMLQLVDDTRYRAPELDEVGWPDRWKDRSPADVGAWRPRDGQAGFETAGPPSDLAWLRYRHVVPWSAHSGKPEDSDWLAIEEGRLPERLLSGEPEGQLITDHYAYNNAVEVPAKGSDPDGLKAMGLHWVGDLAVECDDVQVGGDSGELLLDLVEGGVHYTCRIDVSNGSAVLSMDGGDQAFVDEHGNESLHPTATTKVIGPGTYDLRFSNCDDQLLLWVNNRVADFDGPTTYVPAGDVRPQWSEGDPGDLEPAGIGALGVQVSVERLRVLRDVYYVATTFEMRADDDYEESFDDPYIQGARQRFIRDELAKPESWSTSPLFPSRRAVEFTMKADQFFPLGDNSPQSRDARLWSQSWTLDGEPDPPGYVRRDLLIGKALLIYWPHAWRRPIPFLPNFRRMGLIR